MGYKLFLIVIVDIVIWEEVMVMFYDFEWDEGFGLIVWIVRKIIFIKNFFNIKFWCVVRVCVVEE